MADGARERQLERWIETYADAVLRLCFVYLGDRWQAEDAMQDTFLKAWRSLSRFEGRGAGSEKAWLMRIAVNTCHDYRRSRWFRHIDAAKALEELPARYVTVLPEDRSLLLEVCRLPEKHKQVLLLYYYQEMPLTETAAALGVSRSAAHKRLQKAVRALRDRWTGRDIDA